MRTFFRPKWTNWRFEVQRRNHRPLSTTLLSVLKTLFQSTSLRLLLLTGLAWIIIFNLFDKHLFWREPHSRFFKPDTAHDLIYSRDRLDESDELLAKTINDPEWTPTYANGAAICAGIGTVKRDINYLNGSIGTMLATLTPEERSAIEVRLSFVSTHPESHPDWDAPWMKLVDYKGGYNVSDAKTRADLVKWESDMEFVQTKGVWDYVYLLNDCYERSTAPYIGIFEDDIVFAEGWLSKTMTALADLKKQPAEWLYLRLFYTETYHVFWDGRDFWHEHHYLAYGIGASVTAVILFLIRGCSKHTHKGLSYLSILVIACVMVPTLIKLAFMVPKHTFVHNLNHGLTRMEGACCTQALVFARSQVPDVMAYLTEKERGQTDLLIEDYAHDLGLARFAVEPQQVQHVGRRSSRGVDGVTTWAYLFETYNRASLKREHQKSTKWSNVWRPLDDTLNLK